MTPCEHSRAHSYRQHGKQAGDDRLENAELRSTPAICSCTGPVKVPANPVLCRCAGPELDCLTGQEFCLESSWCGRHWTARGTGHWTVIKEQKAHRNRCLAEPSADQTMCPDYVASVRIGGFRFSAGVPSWRDDNPKMSDVKCQMSATSEAMRPPVTQLKCTALGF